MRQPFFMQYQPNVIVNVICFLHLLEWFWWSYVLSAFNTFLHYGIYGLWRTLPSIKSLKILLTAYDNTVKFSSNVNLLSCDKCCESLSQRFLEPQYHLWHNSYFPVKNVRPGMGCIPVIPALRRLIQEDHHEFKASLDDKVSSRIPWTANQNCVSKRQKDQKKEGKKSHI